MDEFFTKLEYYDPQTYVIKFLKRAVGLQGKSKQKEEKQPQQDEQVSTINFEKVEEAKDFQNIREFESTELGNKLRKDYIEQKYKQAEINKQRMKEVHQLMPYKEYVKHYYKLHPELVEEIKEARKITWQEMHEMYLEEYAQTQKRIDLYKEKGYPWYSFLKFWTYFYDDDEDDKISFSKAAKWDEDMPKKFVLPEDQKYGGDDDKRDLQGVQNPKLRRVLFQETWDEFDPIYFTFVRTGIPERDNFFTKMENYQMYHSTYTWFNWTLILMMPGLIGMAAARQLPKLIGSGTLTRLIQTKLQFRGGFLPEMTRREAGLILNVKQNATPDEIRNRHRKLMITNHPDNKGSALIASKINQAKELLLGENN
ncbi:hypothetical protein IMG5_124820 [Ichthyophthirius multifiliis]|uniref:J domain-containing protein n=1 Tax=Ichthyophthirius multifiliis TaxID=5932 RepID=G0QVM8_ICHMU|nr:hypothetical protein IMG5_124820 [Ichthyophthirius multifiliis]EGR30715.1 hypothetical protein IMG5_124820 [Ichthyophthirius multifiliis]|eukprot:XP_004032302.1 hypothetical protein IMG5_124820 [Ichthyophthirius multifiliis]